VPLTLISFTSNAGQKQINQTIPPVNDSPPAKRQKEAFAHSGFFF